MGIDRGLLLTMTEIKKEENIGKGIGESYKKDAHNHIDFLWRVDIKGRKYLVDNIPLHMSLKIFKNKKEFDLKEIKEKIKEFKIKKPDPKKIKFKTTIFHAPKSDKDYYMLLLENTDKTYNDFYNFFKDNGITYKKFMPHITIDKHLYDKINKEGLKPNEIIFNDLSIEDGADNTIKEFKKSELEKKSLKHLGTTLGVAGALATAQPAMAPKHEYPKYSSQRMLNAISQVESQGGKNENYPTVGGIHGGERAYGKYGLMPLTIRETIKMNPDLANKYKKALNLRGNDLAHYIQDNPGLEDTIAQRHLQRLEHHFGQNPEKLGYAWNQGIKGTYDASKQNKDINNHWHVRKIRHAYEKEK